MSKRTFAEEAARHCKYYNVNTFAYLMNISLRYRYWYADTPGTGDGCIKLILQRAELEDPDYQPPYGPRWVHARRRSPLLGPQQMGAYEDWLRRDDILRFCWTRDPYMRFLSAYLDYIRPPGPMRSLIVKALRALDRPLKPEATPGFEDFLFAVEHETIVDMSPDWKPQYHLTLSEMIDYDFIGRFEHFERDMRGLASRLGFDYDRYAGHLDAYRTSDPEAPERYYTPALRRRVAKLYEADFDCFGYSPSGGAEAS